MVGLLAGVLGAVTASVVAIPINLILGPMSRAMMRGLLENNDLPPNVRAMFENSVQNEAGALQFVLTRLVLFVILLMVGGFFSTLGGLLGAVLFSRRTPAAPTSDLRLG